MIPMQYVWLVWASAFLIPWVLLYWRFPPHRQAMRWASLFTLPFGLTEPLFVPEYWDPPSLFDLAQRTGFDLESLIFCFGIGGVAAVLVNVVTGRGTGRVPVSEKYHPRHAFHRRVLVAPFLLFVLLLPLEWNPIYPAILVMFAGALLNAWCRPDLWRRSLLGSMLFLIYYVVFLAGLEVTDPAGYIATVWNLDALSGWVLAFMPAEELLFALGFGAYWAGVYDHFTWHRAEPEGVVRITPHPNAEEAA